jgi:hypothetical protein
VFYYGGDVHSYHNGSDEFSWLTSDELDAIHEALIRSHKKKSSRMQSSREARHKSQREKYKEIYCESDR